METIDRTTESRAPLRVHVKSIHQLFETMDPSPFIEKDLDPDAEEFIVSWAREYPRDARFQLAVHLAERPGFDDYESHVREGIRHYFEYRGEITRNQFRQLLRIGWRSAAIGLTFLTACLFAADAIGRHWDGRFSGIVAESLVISGWVAMWRPLEIFLYEWWPLRATEHLFQRLSQSEVTIIPGWQSE
jgi:hypothetical protein